MIHLGIIEDETLVVENLELFLKATHQIDVVIATTTVEEFLEKLEDHMNIDIILLDIGLPAGMSGLHGIRHIKKKLPNVDILMLTARDDSDTIFKALCAGAVSYISKRTDLPTIRDAIMTVNQGGSFMSPSIARKVVSHFAPKKQNSDESPLTPRQEQIVEGLVDGLSYKLIADKYLISVETVRDHIKKIYKNLQVNSKAEVIRKRLDGEI